MICLASELLRCTGARAEGIRDRLIQGERADWR
jgi:hypothetical protein